MPLVCSLPRMLVIDDEPAVGPMVRRALRNLCDVQLTSRAIVALERVLGGEHFAFILCDVMMSEMTGLDVVAAITREEPELLSRFALMSGSLSSVGVDEHRFAEMGIPVLSKPFTSEELIALVKPYIARA